MAKSKSTKSSSATIGFEQQIWDAACELWGHIDRKRCRRKDINTYIGKVGLFAD